MRRKLKDIRTINLFDFVFFVACFAAISWIVQGHYRLYSAFLLIIAILAEIVRLLIQKHNYQNMTSTEKEIYLETCTLLSYRPRK